MNRLDDRAGGGAAYARVFTRVDLPDLVFESIITHCAWFYFDTLCSSDGWFLLRELARKNGDLRVHAIGIDLHHPRVVTLQVDADAAEYGALCDDEFVCSDVVRWWGGSGRWGIHGSRGREIAVAGQVNDPSWPRVAECEIYTMDAAMRAQASADDRQRLLASYDALAWDPDDHGAVLPLVEACRGFLAGRIDPVVAIRVLCDLLDRVPRQLRRIAATDRLREAAGRTQYLLIGAARAPFGPLLLAHNDRNQAHHADEERPLVRRACEEILARSTGESHEPDRGGRH